MQLLKNLARETEKAIFLSTHDLELALRSADRICLLSMEGSLQTGVPEDLVLQGGFEHTFHSEGVRFDRELGHFMISEPKGPRVTLHALLARAGFRVTESTRGVKARVRVVSSGKGLQWKSFIAGAERSHPSIEELLFLLQDTIP